MPDSCEGPSPPARAGRERGEVADRAGQAVWKERGALAGGSGAWGGREAEEPPVVSGRRGQEAGEGCGAHK